MAHPAGRGRGDAEETQPHQSLQCLPRWLAHVVLDRAIWSAIGRHEPPEETADETILGRLLAVNLERAAASKAVRHS